MSLFLEVIIFINVMLQVAAIQESRSNLQKCLQILFDLKDTHCLFINKNNKYGEYLDININRNI